MVKRALLRYYKHSISNRALKYMKKRKCMVKNDFIQGIRSPWHKKMEIPTITLKIFMVYLCTMGSFRLVLVHKWWVMWRAYSDGMWGSKLKKNKVEHVHQKKKKKPKILFVQRKTSILTCPIHLFSSPSIFNNYDASVGPNIPSLTDSWLDGDGALNMII